jgi:hypothetical protein
VASETTTLPDHTTIDPATTTVVTTTELTTAGTTTTDKLTTETTSLAKLPTTTETLGTTQLHTTSTDVATQQSSTLNQGIKVVSLTGLGLSHFCVCATPRHGFPASYVMIFLCSVS